MNDLRNVAAEYAALEQASERNDLLYGRAPAAAGDSGNSGGTNATAWAAAALKVGRLYTEDPRPFYLVGLGLVGVGVAIFLLAVRGFRK